MKQSEINQLSTDEVIDKLSELQVAYQKLKYTHSITPLENPVQIRLMRRDIARLKTSLVAKQNESK